MKNKNLILYLVVVVITLCTATNNVLAQSLSDMESLSKQMDEAIKKLF